jgi:hypothetical protein
MKLWFRLTIICWALVCLFLSLSQQVSRNHQPHLICSRPWIDRCKEAASDSPTAAIVSIMEFDPLRAGPLTSLVLDGAWTPRNIGPPGQEPHGPPEPIEPWRAAGSKQAAQRKHRATLFQEILGQPTEFEESAFCNSL